MNGFAADIHLRARLLLVLAMTLVGPPAIFAEEPSAENTKTMRQVKLYRHCVIRFIDRDEAAEFLTVEDAFLSGLSRFDLQSRLQTTSDVTTADYLAMTVEQLLDWKQDEIARLSAITATLRPKLEQFDLPFPDEVVLIKYSGHGEAGAAYTRGNGIVFPQQKLAADVPGRTHLMLHELFHVISRHDACLRSDLYKVIGFKPCNPIPIPETLADLKISNPDAPTIDYYITIDDRQEDQGQVSRPVVPVLLASEAFDPARGRSFFDYLEFKLMEIEQVDDEWRPRLVVTGERREPVLIDGLSNESYRRQIGRNTNYVIHPDEILADNFAFLIAGREQLPTPEILDSMSRLLQIEDVRPQP